MDTEDEPEFTHCEIIESLKGMSHKRAPGLDHLTSDIYLRVAMWFPIEITGIMNCSLRLQYFPKMWKMATAKIILKPGKDNYHQLSSFRLIGLINVFGKLLERLITNRLMYHLESTHSSVPNQYGFKNQKSTVLAINSALDIIRTAKTNGDQVIAVSLDIKAAFDRAWWPAIFRRLRDVNCPRNL